ncbi:MAG TPA: hypothetical protein VKY32_05690 [Flavobacterium sp.]|nr:hypothetical protein [Flavobacterium sp.]
MLKKLTIYIIVFLIITFLLSYDEIVCAWNKDATCLANLIGKLVIFMLLMFLLDKFILKKKNTTNEK